LVSPNFSPGAEGACACSLPSRCRTSTCPEPVAWGQAPPGFTSAYRPTRHTRIAPVPSCLPPTMSLRVWVFKRRVACQRIFSRHSATRRAQRCAGGYSMEFPLGLLGLNAATRGVPARALPRWVQTPHCPLHSAVRFPAGRGRTPAHPPPAWFWLTCRQGGQICTSGCRAPLPCPTLLPPHNGGFSARAGWAV
jgi:hypothetical protein